jgi:hypothetical protein
MPGSRRVGTESLRGSRTAGDIPAMMPSSASSLRDGTRVASIQLAAAADAAQWNRVIKGKS